MGGQAARYSHISKHFHVCIDAEPAEGVSDASYAEALKLASLKANVYLAKLGLGQKPDYSERFEWTPIEYKPGEKRLPRVAILCDAPRLARHVELPLLRAERARLPADGPCSRRKSSTARWSGAY